jgi:1-acyl-sn-glycerol-3-phosphate acyltransferase
VRLGLLVLWTLCCSPILLLVVIFGTGNTGRRMRLGAATCRLWARGMIRILGVRYTVEGPLPPPGSFVVSNHVSWVDILLLASVYPSNFIAKKEVGQIPLVGFLSQYAGTLFLDRERARDAHRMNAELQGLFQAGLTISIFPEGYCADGQSLLPFKSSLFGTPAELKVPCVPAAVHYNLPEIVWNDQSTVPAHARQMLRAAGKIGGIRARIRFGTPLVHPDRKVLAAQAEQQVVTMFEPMGELR